MQEYPENNGRIRNNGIFELIDSNQTRAVDGKQRIYLEWPYEDYTRLRLYTFLVKRNCLLSTTTLVLANLY